MTLFKGFLNTSLLSVCKVNMQLWIENLNGRPLLYSHLVEDCIL